MKLVCKLTINVNPSVSNKRPVWGCVNLGRESGRDENQTKAVLLCELSRSSTLGQNKYNLRGNISTLHDRFIEEGRLSISFKSPSHTVFVDKAEVTKLRKLVLLIRQLSRSTNQLPATLPKVSPQSALNTFKQPMRSINVCNRGEYERKLLSPPSGFSESAIGGFLTKIRISNCTLKLAPRHIRGLKLLELSLSNNDLRSSTFIEIKSPVLANLSVTNCVNATPPPNLFTRGITYPFSHSLTILNLSGNKWTVVPVGIFQFQNLTHLDLSGNQFTTIPDKLTSFPKLQKLTLANNQLKYLPSTIITLRLVHLDISRNPFHFEGMIMNEASPLISLEELALRTILQYNFKIEDGDIPRLLLQQLQNCNQCVCGRKYTIGAQRIKLEFDVTKISIGVDYHQTDDYNTVVPIDGTLCHSYTQCYINKISIR